MTAAAQAVRPTLAGAREAADDWSASSPCHAGGVGNRPSGRCLADPPSGAGRPLADAHGNERTGLSETGLAEPHPKGPSDPDAMRRQGG